MTRRLVICLALLLAAASARPPVVWGVPPNIDLSPPDFVPPDAERAVLSNGVVVYLVENHELPIFDMHLMFRVTPSDETPAHSFDLFGEVWRTGGTKSLSPDALDEELEALAAAVETGADNESAGVSVSCLSRDIPRVLDIWADVLLNPQFNGLRLLLAKGQQLEGIRRRNETPHQVGRRAFRRVTYGADHVYARDPMPEDFKRVSRADLQKIHRRVTDPANAVIAVAGDFDKKALLEGLEKRFAGWTASPRPLTYDYTVKSAPPGKVFVVDKDFSQSRVAIGQPGISRLDPDRFAVAVGDYILGGGGPSRLFGEIRSRLGLAYMVGSFIFNPAGPGMIGVVSQTKAQSTAAVTEAIIKELKKFSSEPVTDAELDLAKSAILNNNVFGFDSPYEIAKSHAAREFFGFEPDALKLYPKRIKAVTKQDILKVAKKYYDPANSRIVVVGDTKKFDAPLDKFGAVTFLPIESFK